MDSGQASTSRVLVKSVGWGWVGYHAYIAGTRLAGFVPRVIGLRNGLLFSEWIEGKNQISDSQQPVTIAGERLVDPDNMLLRLSTYVAKRVEQLRLAEDPYPVRNWGGAIFPVRTAWDELVEILRDAYSSFIVGRLKAPALRRGLQQYVSPVPTLIDGQMKLDEWITTSTGIYKVDFEHYNCIRAAIKTADPAYDLAAAVFEFQLSEPAEQKLLEEYRRSSGDQTIEHRLTLYKLVYAVYVMQQAAMRAFDKPSAQEREAANQRYISIRNFLIYQMQRFCAGAVTKIPIRDPDLMRAFEESADIQPGYPTWSKRLFFLDLDGVFDRLLLGSGIFPHTTVSGPIALLLLRAGGFSVVLNTGRSVEHVRHYCRTYHLPGGVAEHGCVFVDAIEGRELVLIDAATAERMGQCREAIKAMPGVFIDPGYQYSIRAYRYDGQCTVALGGNEVQQLLMRSEYDLLTFITGPQETYIVPKALDKGTGLSAVRKYLGGIDELIGAIGDSVPDLPMLEVAKFSYAPANCSLKVRETASNRVNLHIMHQPYQPGLLAAVQDLLSRSGAAASSGRQDAPRERSVVEDNGKRTFDRSLIRDSSAANQDLLISLLQIAERPRWQQFLAALNWRGL